VAVRSSASSDVFRFIERERLVIAVVALYATLALAMLPVELNQDGWVALVSGRLIAHDGLPHHESLTVWSSGAPWVDQQWLSQLVMYGLDALGGLRLLLLAHVALIASAFATAVVAARRRAAPLTVGLVAILAFVPLVIISFQVRTQAFGLVLFAVVLALLLRDARSPSGRVWIVLPLLAVWANLHGSVLFGAVLVGLYGLTVVVSALRAERSRNYVIRGLGLTVGGAAALFASPYATDLPAYYKQTAFNPAFREVIVEWAPTTPSARTAAFYALLLLSAWAIGRRGREMTAFEQLVLLATGVAGMLSLRNTAWFALAAIMIVPGALDPGIPRREPGAPHPARLAISVGPVLALALLVLITLARPARWFEHRYPAALPMIVARAAAPDATIFSDLRFSDWLLWHRPDFAGRIAFDARVELLTADQLRDVGRFVQQRTDHWRRAADRSHVIVLDRRSDPGPSKRPATYEALLGGGGFRLAYLSPAAAVLVRTD
jgi:hypothetical protein